VRGSGDASAIKHLLAQLPYLEEELARQLEVAD
jgi:hypothetical protein